MSITSLRDTYEGYVELVLTDAHALSDTLALRL